jgi:hypothetical protein
MLDGWMLSHERRVGSFHVRLSALCPISSHSHRQHGQCDGPRLYTVHHVRFRFQMSSFRHSPVSFTREPYLRIINHDSIENDD